MECPVTGIKTRFGNRVSHANNKTRRTWEPNMQTKRIYVPEVDRHVRVRISADELRTIDKIGFMAFIKRRGISIDKLLD